MKGTSADIKKATIERLLCTVRFCVAILSDPLEPDTLIARLAPSLIRQLGNPYLHVSRLSTQAFVFLANETRRIAIFLIGMLFRA